MVLTAALVTTMLPPMPRTSMPRLPAPVVLTAPLLAMVTLPPWARMPLLAAPVVVIVPLVIEIGPLAPAKARMPMLFGPLVVTDVLVTLIDPVERGEQAGVDAVAELAGRHHGRRGHADQLGAEHVNACRAVAAGADRAGAGDGDVADVRISVDAGAAEARRGDVVAGDRRIAAISDRDDAPAAQARRADGGAGDRRVAVIG